MNEPRHLSTAARMHWRKMSPRERVAFMLGFTEGKGLEFPGPKLIAHLRRELGDIGQHLCRACTHPIPPRDPPRYPGQKLGRPPALCPACIEAGVK